MEELTLSDLATVFRRYWRSVLLVPFCAAVAGGAGTLLALPRTYEAKATVLVSKGGGGSSLLSSLLGNMPLSLSGAALGLDGGAIDTYRAILESRHLRETVAKKLALDRLHPAKIEKDPVTWLGEVAKIGLDAKASMLVVRVTTEGTPRLRSSARWGPGDLDARHLAAEIANAYVSSLDEYVHGNFVFQAQRNRVFIENRADEARGALARAETELLAFQNTKGIASLPDETKELVARQAELHGQKTTAEVSLKEATEQLRTVKARLLAQAEAGVTESFPDTQAVVTESRKRLAELEVELAVKSESLAASNPEIRQLERERAETTSRLKGELARAYGHVQDGIVGRLVELEAQQTAAEARISGLGRALSRGEAQLAELPDETVGFGRLQRELEMKQEVYRLLTTEAEMAKVQEAREVTRLEVLDPAVAPTRKKRPSTVINAGLCGLATFLAVTLLAFSVEQRRRLA